ncbi:hypothetical protein ACHAXH_003100 [Discostella pseudostelligera]
MTPPPTHYDILGVPRNADAINIRKSYLRSSLRCHPDKNPGREEEAKAEFIKVGQAYAVLSDEAKRAAYDRELDRGYWRKSSSRPTASSRPRPSSQQQQQSQQQQPQQSNFNNNDNKKSSATDDGEFDTFMRMFDETVSGMSEDELNMAIGAAAVVGGLIGSILGARAIKNPFLANAASIVGSAMASQAASKFVQTLHEDSQQRMLERGEREAAIARGETVQGPSSRENRDRVFQDAGRAFQKVAIAAMGGGASASSSARQCSGNEAPTSNNLGAGFRRQGQFSWRQATLICSRVKQQRIQNNTTDVRIDDIIVT